MNAPPPIKIDIRFSIASPVAWWRVLATLTISCVPSLSYSDLRHQNETSAHVTERRPSPALPLVPRLCCRQSIPYDSDGYWARRRMIWRCDRRGGHRKAALTCRARFASSLWR